MSTYSIEFLPSAVREFSSLPRTAQQRIGRRIHALMENPRPEGAKTLEEQGKLLRIRVGDYRVIYQVDDRRLSVLIVRVGHRSEVYRTPPGH